MFNPNAEAPPSAVPPRQRSNGADPGERAEWRGEVEVQKDPIDPQRVVKILDDYKGEAEHARSTGHSARDDIWRSNWELYWSQYNFTKKAPWQAKERPPEAAGFVDRWSALLHEAMIQPGEWYGLKPPFADMMPMEPALRRVQDLWLSRCGRSPQGHEIGFPAVFEEIAKDGAITAGSALVTWKGGPADGYVAVDPIDARDVWLDHTGRNMYRRRRFEMDRHQLMEMAAQRYEGGSLFNMDELARISGDHANDDRRSGQELSSGHGQMRKIGKPVVIDEWLATIVDTDGKLIARNAWCMVANERALILGPTENPFWHGMDWLVFSPFVIVPRTVYGRSYMDSWSSMANTFTSITNFVLDAAQLSSARILGIVVDALKHPEKIREGLFPGMTLELEEQFNLRDALSSVEVGSFPPELFQIWSSIRDNLREGAQLNEIALGQMAPNSGTTATEIDRTSQSSISQIRAMARTIEERILEPILEMVWSCGLQHADFSTPIMQGEIGKEVAGMLQTRRGEFRDRRFRFRAFGISGLIDRSARLRKMLAMIQTLFANPALGQEFMSRYPRMLDELIRLYGLDLSGAQPTPEDLMAKQAAAALQQQRQAAGIPEPGAEGEAPAEGEAAGAASPPANGAATAQMMQGQ